MKHGSLFSGIGGFDLAAQWMGWENVFHCEWDGFCQKVLKHYWPNAKSYGDITTTDFSEWRGRCDIISGGFPCQPYSTAGKRKGKDDHRHLWPEMLRAITEIQPTWVVGENVPGLLNWNRGMVLAEIKADLEAAGFEVFPPVILPACGKNAPHRRDRLWIVAHASKGGGSRGYAHEINRCCSNNGGESAKILQGNQERDREVLFDAHPNNSGLQGSEINRGIGGIGQNGNQQLAGLLQPNWENFPTQSPVCGGNDGVPNRVYRIKALGNSVVPQIVYEIFKSINQLSCTPPQ